MYLSASLTEPGAREVKTTRTWDFFHAENLNIEAPGAVYIFDEQRRMIQFANLHKHTLLKILLKLNQLSTTIERKV
jgi:hypothetical protein